MYLDTGKRTECFGCEGCVQICPIDVITMIEDNEGFRYPVVDLEKCVACGMCRKTCPNEHMPEMQKRNKYVFGGYNNDKEKRFKSTSGGAFSAIVDAFCDDNYVVFGAEAKGLEVFHSYITDIRELDRIRKSKYSQSVIGLSYKNAQRFLIEGKKVLFSGTPCQIAGLLTYLKTTKTDCENLLTVEVVCEGVPSPLYIRKYNKEIERKYGRSIESLDYRYTGNSIFRYGKWDFEIMKVMLKDTKRVIIKDRWFNPFWSIWLQHLMSRPSCYRCPFAIKDRIADITLGDLWGIHHYCPELYGNNGGSSLIICNTEKGEQVFKRAECFMFGHKLVFEDALKYQGPMKKTINENPNRTAFMLDLKSDMDYSSINKKWGKKPTLKQLSQKYIWGNRQKIFVWNIMQLVKQKSIIRNN